MRGFDPLRISHNFSPAWLATQTHTKDKDMKLDLIEVLDAAIEGHKLMDVTHLTEKEQEKLDDLPLAEVNKQDFKPIFGSYAKLLAAGAKKKAADPTYTPVIESVDQMIRWLWTGDNPGYTIEGGRFGISLDDLTTDHILELARCIKPRAAKSSPASGE